MRLFVGLLVVAVCLAGCTGESAATLRPQAPSVPHVPPGNTSPHGDEPDEVDLSAERILAALEQAQFDNSADGQLLLPPSLRSYMEAKGYQPRVVQQGDAAIGTVCKILKEDAAQKILTSVVDAVLVRLRRNPTGDGFGLLVSAAGYGCAGYDTWLSAQIQLEDGFVVPTAPPLGDVPAFERQQTIEITSQGEHVVDIRVDQVTCSPNAGLFTADPGRVFIGVNVSMTAVRIRENDPASWRVVVNDSSIGPGLNLNPDWDPTLRSGALLPGQSIAGWMAFDVPRPSDAWALVHLGSDPDDDALFQLRFNPCP